MYYIEKNAISESVYMYMEICMKRNFCLNQLKIVAIVSHGCSTIIIICDIAATDDICCFYCRSNEWDYR